MSEDSIQELKDSLNEFWLAKLSITGAHELEYMQSCYDSDLLTLNNLSQDKQDAERFRKFKQLSNDLMMRVMDAWKADDEINKAFVRALDEIIR